MPESFDYDGSNVDEVYDTARALSNEVIELWLDALASSMNRKIEKILDLGCGTGRFTAALAKKFSAKVTGVDPSFKLLKVARERDATEKRITYLVGTAESIPCTEPFDLIFMSMVYHHLPDTGQALAEMARLLSPSGILAIRNATAEDIDYNELFQFFPEARRIEQERMPAADHLILEVEKGPFRLLNNVTVLQRFASDYREFYNKIRKRGLSAFQMISDDDFQKGLNVFKRYCKAQKKDKTVHERFHLFVFERTD